MLEIPLPAVEAIAAACSLESVPFLLNAAPVKELSESLLADVTTLIVNEHEAAMLTDKNVDSVDDAIEAGRALLERGARSVIVTLGSLGAVLNESSGATHVNVSTKYRPSTQPAQATRFAEPWPRS